jgi:hypothetical protein
MDFPERVRCVTLVDNLRALMREDLVEGAGFMAWIRFTVPLFPEE